MLEQCLAAIILVNIFTIVLAKYEIVNWNSENAITPKTYAIWRNATVPFYVNPEQFDHEQTLNILNALAMFAFKTCIKFKPVMAKPASTDEVLTFVNPEGLRRCKLETHGHSVFTPHLVRLGYECLKSPQIDMMLMKALGFPFEHNRPDRDSEITVLQENIELGSIDLFTKDETLPLELRYLPYDVNSVMHFGNRDYSKNGHRTIIFKDENIQQNRVGLSPTDLKKIEIVYGPECRARDRQEKIQICQSYPGVARRKREAENDVHDTEKDSNNNQGIVRKKRDLEAAMVTKSLRVNPDITPPPEILSDNITPVLKELGIDNEVQEVVEHVHKVSSLALKNAREKYCHNNTKAVARTEDIKVTRNSSDILGIIQVIADYAQSIVGEAVVNLTKFCEETETKEGYQRYGCMNSRDPRCRESYKSTKSGAVKYSTQHRPVIQFATQVHYNHKVVQYARARNDTQDSGDTKPPARRKREAEATIITGKPSGKLVIINKPEASEKIVDDNVKSKNGQDIKALEKTAEIALQKKVEGEENPVEAVDKNKSESWEKKVEVTDDKKMLAAEVKKVENTGKVDDKSILRMGTMLPGLHDGKRKPKYDPFNRRSFHGKRNRGKHAVYYLEEDEDSGSIEKEPPTIIKPIRVTKKEKHSIKESKHTRKDEIKRPVNKNIVKHSDVDVSQDNGGIEKSYTPQKKKKQTKYVETVAFDGGDSGSSQLSEEVKEKYAGSKKESLLKPLKVQADSMDDNKDVASESREKLKNTHGNVKETKLGKHLVAPADDVSANDEEPNETHFKNIKKYREKDRKESLSEIDRSSIKKIKKQKTVKESESGLPKTVKLSKKNEDFYADRIWPDGQLYFMIQEDTTYDLRDMRRRLAAVNKILKKKTCVRMIEIKPDETERFEDYILIDNSPDYVTGRVGGKQRFGAIELFRGGQHRQHGAMMVMAMLGFYFEVARHDRDKYIRVHMRHVRPDKLHHFEMIRSDATLPLPYDYASATHPAWQFWRQIGRTGISTVATLKGMDPDGTIMKSLGQNAKLLSDSDIIKINSVYGVDCFRRQRAETEASRGKNKSIPTT